MRLRPWNIKKINECHELLIPIPKTVFRIKPHPYMSLGAPYLNGADPWVLRQSVLNRLIMAQRNLAQISPHLQLALFDAWRPISVQSFMFNHTVKQTCKSRGIDFNDHSLKQTINEIVEEVRSFWAPPSSNPATPPPHSTGAAIDLTLADKNGVTLDFGGEIDFIGDISRPNFYKKFALNMPGSKYNIFHSRRSLLTSVMTKAGFAQHPNEWWHFSYGDQLWAWKNKKENAIYGKI